MPASRVPRGTFLPIVARRHGIVDGVCDRTCRAPGPTSDGLGRHPADAQDIDEIRDDWLSAESRLHHLAYLLSI
jgi:hypothetical protein